MLRKVTEDGPAKPPQGPLADILAKLEKQRAEDLERGQRSAAAAPPLSPTPATGAQAAPGIPPLEPEILPPGGPVAPEEPGAMQPGPSPEEAMRMLRQAAGPDAGLPPPDVVGAALQAMGVAVTDENLARAFREALGPDAAPPSAEAIAAAKVGAQAHASGEPLPGAAMDAEAAQMGAASPMGQQMASPESVVAALFQAVGPGVAGLPPPEVIGQALRSAGLTVTAQVAMRALQAAGLPATTETVAAALAGASGAGVPGMGGAAAGDPLGGPESAQGPPMGEAPNTPEEIMRFLIQAAGPGAGVPPADVVGAALASSGLPATADNLMRALREVQGREPSAEEVVAALKGAAQGFTPPEEDLGATAPAGATPAPSVPPVGAGPGAAGMPAVYSTPEEVVLTLCQVAGPGAGRPPPEVVGVAMKASGLPVTAESLTRALRAAAGPSGPEPTAAEVAAAMSGASNGLPADMA